MKKLLPLFLCVATVAACDSGTQPLAESSMKCGDADVSVKVYQDYIDATIDGRTISMEQVVTASGAKYETEMNGKKVALWSKGESWMIVLSNDQDELSVDCEVR
jgi:membrane-bound inhibitor of C-type lysozyme